MVGRGMGMTRREALLFGGLGVLALPGLEARPAPERACILIWLRGGLSHLDSFDPKPDSPTGVRGEFATIPTAVPGLRFSEVLPRLARRADRFTLVRGLDPANGAHGVAEALMLSGRPFIPGEVAPSIGSLAARWLGARGGIPPYLLIGTALDPHFGAGRAGPLGEAFEPVIIPEGSPGPPAIHARLDAPDERSGRYGSSSLGRACLRARRLVEAGCRLALVTDEGWDTHASGFRALSGGLLPRLDRALSALLDDLEASGRLGSTLVAVLTDFGRGPVNRWAGRDHAPRASVALLAGVGVRGGLVAGATDRSGLEPAGTCFGPGDLAATLLERLGLPSWAWPPGGRPIAELSPGLPG